MKIDNLFMWIIAIFIFVSGRAIFSTLLDYSSLFTLAIFVMGCSWFIFPYLLFKDIEVPAYSYILVKGKDDFWRFVYFLLGCALCVAAIAAPSL